MSFMVNEYMGIYGYYVNLTKKEYFNAHKVSRRSPSLMANCVMGILLSEDWKYDEVALITDINPADEELYDTIRRKECENDPNKSVKDCTCCPYYRELDITDLKADYDTLIRVDFKINYI